MHFAGSCCSTNTVYNLYNCTFHIWYFDYLVLWFITILMQCFNIFQRRDIMPNKPQSPQTSYWCMSNLAETYIWPISVLLINLVAFSNQFTDNSCFFWYLTDLNSYFLPFYLQMWGKGPQHPLSRGIFFICSLFQHCA